MEGSVPRLPHVRKSITIACMKVNIKRIDASLPLPQYQTAGSVGFDFTARETVEIAPHALGLVPGNVVVQTPNGYMLMVALRSSTPRKKNLIIPHGLGVIDQDYCGPDDEVKIQVYNVSDSPVVVERGERIAQGVFVRADQVELDEVAEITAQSRGGFGSTGH